MRLKEEAQNWIKNSFNDLIVKILMKNSHLTKTQLETLLIDLLGENICENPLNYEEKARLRILAVSRGAFNRTLRQARWNAIKSIYTVLLLGYIGVFEDTRLDPYLEVANKLRTYMETYRDLLMKKSTDEHLKIVNIIHNELTMSLERLSKPRSMSERM